MEARGGHEHRSASTLGRSRRRIRRRKAMHSSSSSISMSRHQPGFGKPMAQQQLFIALTLFLLLATSITRVSAQLDETTGLRASQAAQTLQSVPRFGRTDMLPNVFEDVFSEEGGSLDLTDDEFVDYIWGIAYSAAAGIVFAVLTFVICCGFCLGRSCCNSCGKREPKAEGYTKRHKLIIFAVMMASTIVVIVFCGIGYQGNDQFSRSLRGDEGLTLIVSAFFDDLGAFFTERLQDGPVNAVNEFIDISLSEIEAAIDEVANVQDSRQQLSNDLTTLSDTFSNFSIEATDNVTGLSIDFPCEYCRDVANEVDDVNLQIETEANATLQEIGRLEVTATDTIQQLAGDVQQQIQEVLGSFNSIVAEEQAISGDIESGLELVDDIDEQRNIAYVILFALPLPIIFMILIGVIVKSPLCFQLTCILSFVVMVLFWLLFAVHLPLGVLLSDACLLLDEQEQNITRMFGPDIGPVMLACLQRTPLTEVYNLTSAIPDASSISFSEDLDGLNTAFNFSDLGDLVEESIQLGNDTFFGTLDEQLDALNEYTTDELVVPPEVYTRENLSTLDPALLFPGVPIVNGSIDNDNFDPAADINMNDPGLKYCNEPGVIPPFNTTTCASFLGQLLITRAVYRTEQATTPMFQEATDDFRAQTSQVNASASDLTANVDDAIANLRNVEVRLQSELFAQVDELVTDLNCEFAGDLYRDVKTGLCEDVLSGILKMIQALFFIPIFSIAISITAIMCWKRVDADGDGTRFGNSAGAKVGNYDEDEYDDYGPAKVRSGYSEGGSVHSNHNSLQMTDYAGNVSRTHSNTQPVNNRTELRYSVNEDVEPNPRGQSLAGVSEHSLSSRSRDYDDDEVSESYTRSDTHDDEGLLEHGAPPPEFDDTPQKPM